MAIKPPPPPTQIPPWLQEFLDTAAGNAPLIGAPAQATPPTAAATAPTTPAAPAPVSGGDYADVFSKQFANQAANAAARNATTRDLLFGQHLGTGGAPVTPENPTGNLSNPWAEGGLFAGNPTNRAAQAIQAQPLWMQGPSGMLIHGSNYPIAPGQVGLPAPASPASETLPPMSPEEQAATLKRYSPPPDLFAQRGLDLTPTGKRPQVY